jgi:hypothetical protein
LMQGVRLFAVSTIRLLHTDSHRAAGRSGAFATSSPEVVILKTGGITVNTLQAVKGVPVGKDCWWQL